MPDDAVTAVAVDGFQHEVIDPASVPIAAVCWAARLVTNTVDDGVEDVVQTPPPVDFKTFFFVINLLLL